MSREDLVGILREQIRSGTLKPGDRLPTTEELMAEHKVSRSTVYEAMRELRKEQLVRGRQGEARYVSLPGEPEEDPTGEIPTE